MICGRKDDHKSKFACVFFFWEADESKRLRTEAIVPEIHEDHIAGKGSNSLHHYNLVHKFIPAPQAMKIPAAKAAVVKECEKFDKILAWNLKSETNLRCSTTPGCKSTFHITDGHLSSEE